MAFGSMHNKALYRRIQIGLQHLFRYGAASQQQFPYSSVQRTHSAPYIRQCNSVQRLLNNVIIASIPCWLIGLWSLGYQSNLAMAEMAMTELPGWRGKLLGALGVGHDPASMFACFVHGLLYFLPIFLIALLVGSLWDAVFAALRRRPLSDGLLLFCWLFAMALPAGADLIKVAIGVSFGFVVGGAIYGGYGRYLVNPALLGLAFLLFAYPDLMYGPSNWVAVPGVEAIPALKLAATGGSVLSAGYSWWDLFIGIRPGPIGTVSTAACLLGAIYLLLTDTASWRIMLGAVLGLSVTLTLCNALASAGSVAAIPLSWHLVLGAFAFGVVFFATDPIPAAMTRAGRWVFGFLIGVLTIIIRVSNPSYNEAVLFAILLASLFSPVIDFVVMELNISRRRRRLTQGAK